MDNQQVITLVPIPYPGLSCYYTNSEGEIFSTNRGKLKKLKIMESYGRSKKQPYIRVKLVDRLFLVHRLVLSAKIGRWLESWEYVNHINGISTDNRMDNLELVTHKQNMEHASEMGLLCSGAAWYEARGMVPR